MNRAFQLRTDACEYLQKGLRQMDKSTSSDLKLR